VKCAELTEYKHVRKTPAELERLRNASDYWRLQLRKELTKFNQQFGIYLRNSIKFSQWSHDTADLGGDYEFGTMSDTLSFSKEKRLEMWTKAYAKKLKALVDEGYGVKLYTRLSKEVQKGTSVEEIADMMKAEMRPRYRSDPNKSPLEVYYTVEITKPKKHHEDL
jgi:hypothetical protein